MLEVYYITFGFLYAVIGAALFHFSNEFIDTVISDITTNKRKAFFLQVLILAMCVFAWPLTMFGYGIGWGGNSWSEKKAARIEDIMMRMIERSGSPSLVDADDWRQWFGEHIHRIPRHHLIWLQIFGFDYCDLDEKELKRLISSELADRDLFGNKR